MSTARRTGCARARPCRCSTAWPSTPGPAGARWPRGRRGPAGGAGRRAGRGAGAGGWGGAEGGDVTVASGVAEAGEGGRLRGLLGGIPAVLGDSPAATPVKTRLRAGGHSIARLDRGGGQGAARATDEMLDAVR